MSAYRVNALTVSDLISNPESDEAFAIYREHNSRRGIPGHGYCGCTSCDAYRDYLHSDPDARLGGHDSPHGED